MSVKTIGVVFGCDSKVYHYLTDLDVSFGEKVIVDSPSNGYVTVTINSLTEGARKIATKWVVNKIDDKDYLARIEKEKLKKSIIEKLEAKKKEVEQMAIYKYLAENDKEASELLDKLKELS